MEIPFYRKDILRIVKQLPVFARAGWLERLFIADRAKIAEYAKGEVIYSEGDPPSAFFSVVSGRVQMFVRQPDGKEQTIEYVHRGKYFGIISLLTGGPHSLSARAANDTVILKIDKSDFESVVERIPRLAVHFSRSLSRRLKRKDLHTKSIFESTILSVYSPLKGSRSNWYVINLGISLKRETQKEVILIDMGGGEDNLYRLLNMEFPGERRERRCPKSDSTVKKYISRHESGIDILGIPHTEKAPADKADVSALISYLTNEYHYILIGLPYKIDDVVLKAQTQSDFVHILFDASVQMLSSVKDALKRLRDLGEDLSEKIKLILSDTEARISTKRIERFLGLSVYCTISGSGFGRENKIGMTRYIPSALSGGAASYSRTIRRIARETGGVLVGLALSSGAAFGLAHIGVIKVLEEEDIPIDVVVGSSMGGLISVFWASGKSGVEMEQIALGHKSRLSLVSLLDFSIPRYGFIRGRKVMKFLHRHLGKKTFYDVKRPVRIAACDIMNKKLIMIEHGLLKDAVRATISIPGIFKPVKYKDSMLVDGAILSPVPVEVLTGFGVDKIIAVNVIPSPEESARAKEEAEEKENQRLYALKKRNPALWFLIKARRKIIRLVSPNIMDIIMNSFHAMEYSLAETACRQADIVICPRTAGTNWFEFYNPAVLIRKGEEEARAAVPKIRKMLVGE